MIKLKKSQRGLRALFALAILAGLFFTGSLRLSAQDLQFSKVLMVTGLDTVPAGKVWKVESALFSPSFSSPPNISGVYVSSATFSVNSQSVVAAQVFVSGYHSGYEYDRAITCTLLTHFPLWLGANATLAAGSNIVGLSVVEFDLVP